MFFILIYSIHKRINLFSFVNHVTPARIGQKRLLVVIYLHTSRELWAGRSSSLSLHSCELDYYFCPYGAGEENLHFSHFSVFFFRNRTRLSKNDTLVAAGNITGDVLYEWEYYYDYLDPVIVDASKLKYNKCKFLYSFYFIFFSSLITIIIIISFSDSIVIILWISLVAFVGFLFLTLNLMSVTGSMPK